MLPEDEEDFLNDMDSFIRDEPVMTIWEHLDELKGRLAKAFVAFIISFAVVLTVRLDFQTFVVFGYSLPTPIPSFDVFYPMASQALTWMVDYLRPAGVVVVVLDPAEFITEQMRIGAFLALAMSMPFILHQVGKFVSPGLNPNEKRLIAVVTVPAAMLFTVGALFALLFILPFTFHFLYALVPDYVSRELRVGSFLDLVVPFMAGFGLAFELPVVMIGLTKLGLIDYRVWRKHWRLAVMASFLLGAQVPDPTGITMTIVAGVMVSLYAAGCVGAWAVGRNRLSEPTDI